MVRLAEPVRAHLHRPAASATAQVRQVLQAKIVLATADGLTNSAIARELKISVNTVRTWRGRSAWSHRAFAAQVTGTVFAPVSPSPN
ncbi:helix-turn-helix domain-containing protein [Streptomyces camelliae]|uniref:helix-turn-helix domain-containing protein n=1 Tax=Streptomyces camelliae TaxID=3004093 RepID=UPI003D174026